MQGGSTAAGFPYGRWGGLAGMLGDRLELADPDREIDVITTAMAAVNSYTLLDFVDEIIAVQPDAVLIYAGHNEFLGILGVGSTLSSSTWRRATLLHLGLRESRVYQLIRRMVSFVRWLPQRGESGSEPGSGEHHATLMAGAAESSEISIDSETFRDGLDPFERNLAQMLTDYRRAGVRVYVGTLASNERDLPPFSGGPSETVDSETWRLLNRAHDAAVESADFGAARDALLQLIAIAPDSANPWYALGPLERRAGRPDAAGDAYRRAKDLDRLRFRAPEAFNDIVRRLTAAHGATLVDVHRQFTDASPDATIGHELISEHVHPTAVGYFLLADAFYQALRNDGEFTEDASAPTRAQALAEMPITELDRLLADQSVRELKADFPFRAQRQQVRFPPPTNEIEAIAARRYAREITWLESMEALLQFHREAGNIDRAAVVARIAAQAFPDQTAPNLSAGLLYTELRQFARSRRYLERSLRNDPQNRSALRALATVNAELMGAR